MPHSGTGSRNRKGGVLPPGYCWRTAPPFFSFHQISVSTPFIFLSRAVFLLFFFSAVPAFYRRSLRWTRDRGVHVLKSGVRSSHALGRYFSPPLYVTGIRRSPRSGRLWRWNGSMHPWRCWRRSRSMCPRRRSWFSCLIFFFPIDFSLNGPKG